MQVFLKSREELDGFGPLMHLLQLFLGQKLRNFMAHFVRLTKSISRSCLLVIMFTCMTKLKDLPLLASNFFKQFQQSLGPTVVLLFIEVVIQRISQNFSYFTYGICRVGFDLGE